MMVVVRLVWVFGLVWLALLALSRGIRFGTDWPLWSAAIGFSIVVQLIFALYRYECSSLPAQKSRVLIGLRLAALAVLFWVLLEPTWLRKQVREREQEIVVVVDESASMSLKDEGEEFTRAQLASQALQKSDLIARLEKDFRVRTVRVARSLRRNDEEDDAGWKQATDLAAGLQSVLEQVPPDDLGGVVLLSDGRHNRPARVETVARRFGILSAPIVSVAIGNAQAPRDAAVVEVEAPEAMHLGDRMRVRAEVRFEGFKGEKAVVKLMRAGAVLAEKIIAISQESHREEVRFAQVPEADGVGDFRIEIEALEGEKFAENNGWDFETSITDARTNVLLIDRHPRWEFRYLRNLFHRRDKSVHLQWLLLNPDRVQGQEVAKVPASAARPFGDSQASTLPANEEEWRKFDVIILGDLAGEDLAEETWRMISKCVNERAAMLVLVAGPESMPHTLSDSARKLVPVEVEWGNQTYYGTSSSPFQIHLAAAGKGHPITKQADGTVGDGEMWESFPELRWRHPVQSLKEGAEVLLVANSGAKESDDGEVDLRDALAGLSNRSQREAEAALLVTRQTGRGKVALLLTDRTWRLREGSGDLYHHRFWGNLMRWGGGPVLRAGSSSVRLGTDQLTYTPDDVIRLQARLREQNLNPVFSNDLTAEVLRDGKVISTVRLAPDENSNGLHQAQVGPFSAAGRYRVRLVGKEVARLQGEPPAEVGFRVVGSRGPIELADTTLNLPLLQTLAEQSGGTVVSPRDVIRIPQIFLRGKGERDELREVSLWSQWPVLLLFFGLLTAEWILRRGAGLP